MRKMTKEQTKQIEFEISNILKQTAGDKYANYILNQEDATTGNTLMEDIISDVLETSAWEEEGYYNEDDIRLAIGRILASRLNVEV